MKRLIFFSVFCLPFSAIAVEPKAPRSAILSKDALSDVALSEKTTTVLEFPEIITMVSGAGLTEGDVDGLVQISHPKGSRSIVLRSLGKEGRALMQVTVAGFVYGIRLGSGEEPDSVVRFSILSIQDEKRMNQKAPLVTREGRLDEVFEEVSQVKEYTCPEDEVSEPTSTSGNLEIRIGYIAGHAGDDMVVVKGQLKNVGSEAVRVSDLKPMIRIAHSRVLPTSLFRTAEAIVKPGKSIGFTAIIAGDGEGHRANFSLKNHFEVIFSTISPQ